MQSILKQGSNLTPLSTPWSFGERSSTQTRFASTGSAGSILALLLFCLSLALPLSPSAQAQSEPTTSAAVALVNINEAAPEELAAGLVGVGLARAEAIVRYREQFGPFETIDELSEVSGIGAATVDKNRSSIVIN